MRLQNACNIISEGDFGIAFIVTKSMVIRYERISDFLLFSSLTYQYNEYLLMCWLVFYILHRIKKSLNSIYKDIE